MAYAVKRVNMLDRRATIKILCLVYFPTFQENFCMNLFIHSSVQFGCLSISYVVQIYIFLYFLCNRKHYDYFFVLVPNLTALDTNVLHLFPFKTL